MKGVAIDLPLLHVLIVEDDDEQRVALVSLLEKLGCHVDVAVNGADAVRQATRLNPDVVLMDLGMPTMDGWQSIRHVRKATGERPPHVVALSACADARSRQLAFEAGCDEYILKPGDVRGALRAYVLRTQHRRLASTSSRPPAGAPVPAR